MSTESELCIDIIESFKALNSCITSLKEHLCVLDASLPAWFQSPTDLNLVESLTTREKIHHMLAQLEYYDGQNPKEILVGAGLVAMSIETMDCVIKLNAAKEKFKSSMIELKKQKVPTNLNIFKRSFENILPSRDKQLGNSLNRLGLGRLHLKQCYRKIPIFEERPKKISWTWANTRAIKKISVQEAEMLLNKQRRDSGIEQQLLKIKNLDPKENLAIIQELAPHLRANILFESGERKMVKGPVPLFYIQEQNLGLPDFQPPGSKKGRNKNRSQRSDVKISPRPYLPAIHAHRYLAETQNN